MPSSTETYLCDRFTAQEQGFYLGGGRQESVGVPLHRSTPGLAPTCASHKYTPKLQHGASCVGSRIQFLTYPLSDQIYPAAQLPPCHHAFLEVTGRTDKGGRVEAREGRQKEGGGVLFHRRVMSSSGPGRCFLIFFSCADKWLIVSLDKGTVFPVMGIRGRRKSPRRRVRLSQ